jgi:hypothetical protein
MKSQNDQRSTGEYDQYEQAEAQTQKHLAQQFSKVSHAYAKVSTFGMGKKRGKNAQSMAFVLVPSNTYRREIERF